MRLFWYYGVSQAIVMLSTCDPIMTDLRPKAIILHMTKEEFKYAHTKMVSSYTAWCPILRTAQSTLQWSGVVWCGVVWCGVVWCGVVWCGVVWCGVVWCGVV